MSNQLLAIKEIFYDLLQPEQPTDEGVNANQQMALQLSKSVQDKGVFIIQNQTQLVQKHVVQMAIKGMRIIDDLMVSQSGLSEPRLQVKEKRVLTCLPIHTASDPLTNFCNYCLDNKIALDEGKKLFTHRLVEVSYTRFGTDKAASKAISVSKSGYSIMKRKAKKASEDIDTVYIDTSDDKVVVD